MKVVGVLPLYPPKSMVGAWISTHACLAHLAQAGHDVSAVTTLARFPVYELDGVTVHPRAHLRTATQGVDVIVSHLGDRGQGAHRARQVGARSVRMVHGAVPDATALLAAGPTDLVVWNSQATAEATDWWGPAITVRPPIRPADYRVQPGMATTLVNLAKEKGGELFWRLTEAMPGREFLGVMGGYGVQQLSTEAEAAQMLGLERVGNVSVWRPRTDAREIYAATRVLIMPSEVESFGRVGLEAMCSGIPVVAHPSPGLCEALGDAAIWCDRNDQAAWVGALHRLDDPTEWAIASEWGLEHTRNLDPSDDLERFTEAIETVAVGVMA